MATSAHSRRLTSKTRDYFLYVRAAQPAKIRRLFIVVFFTSLYAVSINTSLYTWGDNAHYIIVGKSLATGWGFRDILFPDNPAFKFPIPVFPLLLAPIIYFFDDNLLAMKIFVAVIGVGVVYITYYLFKHLLNEAQALALTLLVGVSPQIVSFSHQVMTEIPYLFFSLLSLLLIEKYASDSKWFSPLGLLTVFVLSIAFLTKSIGVTLVAASVLHFLCASRSSARKNYKKAFFITMVSGAVFILTNFLIFDDIAYIREFLSKTPYASYSQPAEIADFMERVLRNIVSYINYIPETILYSTCKTPMLLFTTVSFVILTLGFGRCILRFRTSLDYYIVFYLLILLLYEPSNSGNMQRYLVPIIPFIFYYFMQGLRQLKEIFQDYGYCIVPLNTCNYSAPMVREIMRFVATGLQTAAVISLILINLTETVQASVLRTQPEMFDYYRFGPWEDYKKLSLWTNRYIPKDNLIMTRFVYFFHLLSQRKVVGYPDVHPPVYEEDILQSIYETKANYIVIDAFEADLTSTYEAITHVIRKNPEKFKFSHQEGPNMIYHVQPRE